MAWKEPQTDRLSTQPQNAEDYNRVEENTEYLLDVINSIGYLRAVVQEKKTDWSDSDIDTLQHHLRIISNINEISFIELTGLKTLRTDLDTTPPDNEDYNDWETNISIIYDYAISSLNGIKRLSFRLGGDKIAT